MECSGATGKPPKRTSSFLIALFNKKAEGKILLLLVFSN